MFAGCFCASEKPQFERSEPNPRATLLFVGDIMCHAPQIAKAKGVNGYDFNSCFKYVKPIFEDADYTVANLETTLGYSEPYSGYPRFKSPAALAEALAAAGVDMVSTANNHTLDYGAEGVLSTIDIVRKCGLEVIGTNIPNPLRIRIKGIDFAFLTYTHSTNGIALPEGVSVPMLDTLAMARDLAAVSDADCRVAFLHWGTEYSSVPSRGQRAVADFLYRAGCQIVIGSHPHTVQGAVCDGRRVTAYSLGNFISNQSGHNNEGGIMARVTVEKCADGCQYWLDIEPVWVDRSDYTVIPKSVGDTLAMNSRVQASYRSFMSHTAKLFKKSL